MIQSLLPHIPKNVIQTNPQTQDAQLWGLTTESSKLGGPGVKIPQLTEKPALHTHGLANKLCDIFISAEHLPQSALLWLAPLLPHQNSNLHRFITCTNPRSFSLDFGHSVSSWKQRKCRKTHKISGISFFLDMAGVLHKVVKSGIVLQYTSHIRFERRSAEACFY